MREAEAVKQEQRRRDQYAEAGSSAQELKREERENAMINHAARSRGTD